jgi:hypothetical protein
VVRKVKGAPRHELSAVLDVECRDAAEVTCQLIAPVEDEPRTVPVAGPGGALTVALGAREGLRPGHLVVVRVAISGGNLFDAIGDVVAEPELLAGRLEGDPAATPGTYELTAVLEVAVEGRPARGTCQVQAPEPGPEVAFAAEPPGGVVRVPLGVHAIRPAQVAAASVVLGGERLAVTWAAPPAPPAPEPAPVAEAAPAASPEPAPVATAAPPPPEPGPAAGPAAPAGHACPGCGHAVRPGAKFCEECGAAQPRACPSCGAAARAGVKFCTGCGARLPA